MSRSLSETAVPLTSLTAILAAAMIRSLFCINARKRQKNDGSCDKTYDRYGIGLLSIDALEVTIDQFIATLEANTSQLGRIW